MPIARVSDDGHAILLRLARRTGKSHGELIEDALALLAGKMASGHPAQETTLPQARMT